VDKRRVRRDRADFFCTVEEGVKGARAVEWRLVDEIAPRSKLDEVVKRRAAEFAARTDRPAGARGLMLAPLERSIDGDRIRYAHVAWDIDRSRGLAEITVGGPSAPPPADVASIHEAGCAFWPLALARELDDLILHLRTNEDEIGLWVLRTSGRADLVEAYDRVLAAHREDWLVREIRLYLKRTFKRVEVSSRSVFALVGRARASPAPCSSSCSPPTAPTCWTVGGRATRSRRRRSG
jgi:benzoyl-CoA-dihydrodiol lyase